MKVHLLVSDGVFDLGLAALTDTLGLANAMAGSLPQAPAPIEITLVAVRRRIRTAQGPLCQDSCRPDRTENEGGENMRDRSGAIRTGIQEQGGGQAAAARGCLSG